MADSARRELITMVAPTPPPYAGPEISTAQLLSSPLAQEFSLIHIRSNLKASNADKGTFSLSALAKQLGVYARIIQSRLVGSRGLYVLLAVNVLGFLKDAGCVWLGKLLGMRVVAHMKGETLPGFYNQSPRLLRWLIRRTVHGLEIMIVQAIPIRHEIAVTFGLDEQRLPIVPNMIESASECDRPRSGRRLLYVGHLSVGKGFVDLLKALEDVFLEHPDTVLRCAGEPILPGRDYVARLMGVDFSGDASELIVDAVAGRLPQVEYMGLVYGQDKEELLCNSDILILPSYSESFPMAVLEAMNHGCAVIATNVGGLPEMIQSGSQGILVAPGDRPSLTAAIQMLLSDEEMRRRLASAARAKVEAAYTMEKVAPFYTAAFKRLLAPAAVRDKSGF